MQLKNMTIICSFLFLYTINIYSQETLIGEDFSDRNDFIDNTLNLIWGSYSTPQSGYLTGEISDNNGLTYNSIYFSDSAMKYSNYHDTSWASTKASTCLDWPFGPIDRSNDDTVTITFDILWSEMDNSGEKGRVNCMLLHNYPSGGPDFNDVDSLNKAHPFGQPAYHIRIRNTKIATDKGFIGIGGGNDPDGRLYIHNEYSGPDSLHWLPGAVPPTIDETNAGMGFPEEINQVNYSTSMASATAWQHITWIIEPEKLKLYVRDSENTGSGPGTLIKEVAIPKTNPGNYFSMYKWYDTLEAFRIYAYGRDGTNTYLANLKIETTGGVVTSVNNTERDNSLHCYPNPFNTFIHVNNESGKIQNATIHNLTGKVIKHLQLNPGANKIHLEHIPAGFYLLKQNGDTVKLIKK